MKRTKRTTQKTFRWLLSDKPAKLKKKIEKIRIEFFKMIEDGKR